MVLFIFIFINYIYEASLTDSFFANILELRCAKAVFKIGLGFWICRKGISLYLCRWCQYVWKITFLLGPKPRIGSSEYLILDFSVSESNNLFINYTHTHICDYWKVTNLAFEMLALFYINSFIYKLPDLNQELCSWEQSAMFKWLSLQFQFYS